MHFQGTTLAALLRFNADLLGCWHDHPWQTRKRSASLNKGALRALMSADDLAASKLPFAEV